MTDPSVIPFDLYRANLAFALQMLSFGHEARQQAGEFHMQRVRRDLAAAQAIRNAASTARDWNEFAASCQSVAREYLTTTASLWQQGLGSAVRLQSGYGEGLREALATWQSAWSEQWPTHVPMNPVMQPWQEWLQYMQGAAAGMPYRRADRGGASQAAPANSANSANSIQPPSSSGGRERRGQRHGG
ncbi:hypothetical protein [Paraburkholderia terricola]|uniref:Phasin protein n=1 Tax=Paraburkholderia terricola TaxID=169427 RepID=A0A1M6VAK1_9BURK|nr:MULTISPECIES: hypothetical protein [Paraburkholderia]ORC49533.1 hypothetical protein B2G74_16215 [Burkholderia sp. A27]SDP01844.1 hypothetical protein SAMN05192547_103711 [Paraburkholderia sediminicola]SHK78510.1 hypothetical protein SAMN05192548_103811 [Paraburkholderia terricola]